MTDPAVRVRRSRADRPPPDWEEVYRRNYLERLKRDRPPLAVREELPELVARGYEEVAEEDMVRLHWWGAGHDKPKVGTFMVRIKAPGGRVTPAQLGGLGRLARLHGRDEVELTTRQGVQFHWVPMAGLPDVVDEVESLGLRTVGAEGDTVRNITGCPVAGLTSQEPFDVTPVIRAVADFFDGNPEYSNLPRKHKYTIAGCPAQCNAPEIADVALVATLSRGRPGFALRVGGGMANTPRISADLGVFVPVDDTVEVLRAVTDVWQHDLRYRLSRARSRIKFMMDDYGPAGMRQRVEERLGRGLPDGSAPIPEPGADHVGVHPQHDGLAYVGVPVPSGRVNGTALERLAEVVAGFGGDVRFTRQQNFVIGSVPPDRLEEVRTTLLALGLPWDAGRAFARSVACTSHRFCNYSVAETKDKLEEILDRLGASHGSDRIGDLGIHLDGCPHACAQHWIGEIGLQGTTTHLEGGQERVQAYDLSVGGGLGSRTAIGRRLLRRVPSSQIARVLDRLVAAWLAERDRHESHSDLTLGDFCDLRGDDELVEIALGHGARRAAEDEPAPGRVVLRVPGPLQEYAGGADELVLTAATVGEMMAAVAEQHPALAEALAPRGSLSGAFILAVGDDDIRTLDGLATGLGPGQAVSIVMARAGG